MVRGPHLLTSVLVTGGVCAQGGVRRSAQWRVRRLVERGGNANMAFVWQTGCDSERDHCGCVTCWHSVTWPLSPRRNQ